jgi:UDP-N-acetylglucosamine transferase subunit ALG13
MMPFERLIQVTDKWAEHHSEQDILAQIGDGSYLPVHMRWTRMLSPNEFRKTVGASKLIVAHAGMGTFFVAMEMRKPIVMIPRRASKEEVTTDHQIQTVQWLHNKPGIYVAMSDDQLADAIDLALSRANFAIGDFPQFAPEPFLKKIRQLLVN